MNVYVESNFVLELTLLQEEQESCERILSLCEQDRATLIIPSYCLAEPNEPLIRRERERNDLARTVERTLKELSRSSFYKAEAISFQEIVRLLRQSGSEERQRFAHLRARLLQTAEIIPLDSRTLVSAAAYETRFDLSPQDALVFASVLQHLNETSDNVACFIEKDAGDFDDPELRELFAKSGCKLMFGFENGLNYLQNLKLS